MTDADENPYVIGPSPYDEATLRRLYHDEGHTIDEVADKLDRAPSTIRSWLIDFGIERRKGAGRGTLVDTES